MPDLHDGGCLCGDIRLQATGQPARTVVCHCRFCQRFTGSAFLVEAIFPGEAVTLSGAEPATYVHQSQGSGKAVTLNFCPRCGTTLFLAFERFPGTVGVCAGAFDDPNGFERGPDRTVHVFVGSAQSGVALPDGVNLYIEHALQLDGAPNTPRVLSRPAMACEVE